MTTTPPDEERGFLDALERFVIANGAPNQRPATIRDTFEGGWTAATAHERAEWRERLEGLRYAMDGNTTKTPNYKLGYYAALNDFNPARREAPKGEG